MSESWAGDGGATGRDIMGVLREKAVVLASRGRRITRELGRRILDCPEAVEASDFGGRIGEEEMDEFMSIYSDFRWLLTNGVAEEIGVIAAEELLAMVHSD